MRALIASLGTAFVSHQFIVRSIRAYPLRRIDETVASFLELAGGPNQFVHMGRADASFRAFVKPSPDLLYSFLVFDVSRSALQVEIPPVAGFWVNQIVAMNSDSVGYIGSRNRPADTPTRFVLEAPETPDCDPPESYERILSPTSRGAFLLRFLIRGEQSIAAIETIRSAIRVECL